MLTPASSSSLASRAIPPGRSSIVSAPQTGTLVAAEGGVVPTPGLAVKKGQAIFTLLPLLSADRAVMTPLERINYEDAKARAGGQAGAV